MTALFMDLCHGMMICERSKEDGASNNTAAAVHQHKWTHRTMIITIRTTPTVKRKHQRFPIVTNVTDFSLGMPQHLNAPRYYQLLNDLIDREDALTAAPMLVKRLRRLREARMLARSTR